MELNEPISYEDKKRMHSFFFESEEGQLFRKIVKDMQEDRLNVAQTAYLKLQMPNEQIVAAVNQASGIKEIIDFIDSIEAEVKAHKKQEEQKQSEWENSNSNRQASLSKLYNLKCGKARTHRQM